MLPRKIIRFICMLTPVLLVKMISNLLTEKSFPNLINPNQIWNVIIHILRIFFSIFKIYFISMCKCIHIFMISVMF